MSYDDQAALSEYSEVRGIDFPLLSDPDSRVIREYGVLNTLIEPTEIPFYGIPFPGTFLIDESGKVIDKFFHRHLANRESAEAIVDRAMGRTAPGTNDPLATFTEDDGIHVSAFFRGGEGTLKVGPVRRLVVRFEVPTGQHLYAPGAPEGTVSTRVDVDAPVGLRVGEPEMPPAQSMRMSVGEAAKVPVQVWSETVDFVFPVFANSELASSMKASDTTDVDLTIKAHYQACDEQTCFLPRQRELELTIPVQGGEVPNFEGLSGFGTRVVEMDSANLFRKLAERQSGGRSHESE